MPGGGEEETPEGHGADQPASGGEDYGHGQDGEDQEPTAAGVGRPDG